MRDDLLKTSFYTSGGKDTRVLTLSEYREKGRGKEGLYRRDNNQFPDEMFDERKYGLHFQTISEALDDYFTHAETKSRGERGYLKRQRLVILDQEYIGKETNSLIDEDILEAQELDHDDLPVVRITRDALNVDLLKSFGAGPLSSALGVSQDAVRKRLFQNSRFSDKTMARLRASIEVDDDGKTRLVPQPFATEDEKIARRVQRQLQLMNAGPQGPLSLKEIEEQIGGAFDEQRSSQRAAPSLASHVARSTAHQGWGADNVEKLSRPIQQDERHLVIAGEAHRLNRDHPTPSGHDNRARLRRGSLEHQPPLAIMHNERAALHSKGSVVRNCGQDTRLDWQVLAQNASDASSCSANEGEAFGTTMFGRAGPSAAASFCFGNEKLERRASVRPSRNGGIILIGL